MLKTGAIVCMDVASQDAPILYAERSEALHPADSGWQFTCGRTDLAHFESAQIWMLAEVLDKEPSLRFCIEMPVGTRLERVSEGAPWKCVH
jgi:hypothetical protein